ncbi:MAG: hypothetical protein IT454_22535 [Planctomycetes bacterium]|nr:hypothetical protein [Planctomycetota bacterium]
MFALACSAWLAFAPLESPNKLAETYATAIEELNAKHAKAPGKAREDELAKLLPDKARRAFDELLAIKSHDELVDALVVAANAAAELDLEQDFANARGRAAQLDAAAGRQLGVLVSRARFHVRGVNGLETPYCEHFADVFEAILGAYDELFGFDEFSKVPGKKLRVLVHLEPAIDRPPHFAPEFPYHSQVDFPVVDARELRSPTPDGKFLFYGLCHELGHVVSMWGDARNEEDHHAWAHYTGVALVEHLARDKRLAKVLDGLDDVKWRSLEKEREAAKSTAPGRGSREAVMALFIALHDELGPKAIGDALDRLDKADKRLRINRVRYTSFDEFRTALVDGTKDAGKRKRIQELLR